MPTPALFRPFAVRGAVLPNRLWVAPMCQYAVEAEDGVPTDWHLVHLGQFALGRAGLVMTEAAAIAPEGRISPQDVGIWTDEQADAWRRIVDFVHAQGSAAAIQLAHAGRKASTYRPYGTDGRDSVPAADGGWTAVGPDERAFGRYAAPAPLDAAGIDAVVEAFAAAASRSVGAGFDVLEVHAAHGYLLHEFLSPLSNDRDDEYSGDLAGRSLLLRRVVRAVRAAAGDDVPVFVRVSASDWTDGGLVAEDLAAVARDLADDGADLIDVSSGGNTPRADIPVGPGYQVPLAAEIRAGSGLPTSAVGLITDAEQADAVIAGGFADAVMMGRELLRDPRLPVRAAAELGADLPQLGPYERAPYPAP